jgi:hypothetical protein
MNWLDQVLHVVVGAIITLVLCFFIPWYFAILISMCAGVAREMFQHPWRCGEGCILDLLFWLLGSITTGAAYVVVRTL